MRRFAWVLGVVAVLMLIGTTATALVAGSEKRLELTGGGLSVRLPEQDWTIGDGVGFNGPDGTAAVGVRRAGLYRSGFCASDRSLTRAFIGFQPRQGRSAKQIAERWARYASYDAETGRFLGHARPAGKGGRADVVAHYPPGPCNPDRIHITVVTRGDSALVLARDVGVPGALSEGEAERITQSLRRRT